MKEDFIQKRIRLVSFKSRRFFMSATDTPNGPNINEPIFDLTLRDLKFTDRKTWFAKVFDVKLTVPFQHEVISIELEYHTVFDCSEPVEDEFLKTQFALVSAPAIGFPYVRAFISTVTIQAGLPPIILPSINFVQYLKESQGISVSEP